MNAYGEQAAGAYLGGLPSGDAGGHQGCDALQLWRAAAAGRGLPARGRVGASLRRQERRRSGRRHRRHVSDAGSGGLATLWVGSFDSALLRDILPGAEGYELVAMINVGYHFPESQPSPMHEVRKTIEEFVTKIE